MRPVLLVDTRTAGRAVRLFVKALLLAALAVFVVYVVYGLVAAVTAGLVAGLLLAFAVRVARWLLRGGGD
ncbi:hypothetical protein [Gandjariella thermophila]|uniref:Uncharacterized protein n=1 Tax=Gandjariella thermophila TaxID=1931992 RepID=A0A4D4J115_9PSEU|nr:hypothetical protein [Gandjariella thermophila]GDY28772.1 hypothetical protein GTS_04050 [Gandjariella thermophila]